MSGRCVCGHGKFLHRKGVCFASVNPCGCRQFEDERQAQKPASHVSFEGYNGQYKKRYSA